MIENEIKSILRNKSNIIYIVIFVIIAIIINISININNIIDKYYDNEISELIKYYDNKRSESIDSQEISDISEILEDYRAPYRTIGLTIASPLDDETIEKIQKINHVQEVKKMQIKDGKTVNTNHVIIDDWKNCNYVQKKLKKIGLDNYTTDQSEVMNSFFIISKYSNIISYFSIIVSCIILIICCNNILKNEKTNYNMLSVLGYKHKKIKNIAFLQLITIIGIGFIFGILIANIIMFIYANIILKIDNYYNVILTILINISVIILSIIISLRKIKHKI